MVNSTQLKAENNSVSDIVLTTLNARYIHSAFGLRYLKANLKDLEHRCRIEEFTLEARPEDAVEVLLAATPKIVGFSVYIWNVTQTEAIVRLLKQVAPQVVVVLGGPEVSYEQEEQSIVSLADYVISGWGERSFYTLATQILSSVPPSKDGLPVERFIVGEQPRLAEICMPYHLYTDDDLKNRVLYVEASRGCPFKCEFCLSALDKTAWPFDLDLFLEEMDKLYQRGARHFKFVDRTFNLKIKNSLRILEFFLEKMDDSLFLHFEVVPDHLPEALKSMISRFPSGSLQFEIGIQTFNSEVQQRISRKQDNAAAQNNLTWIRDNTQAHIHADLIFGLPGEDIDSFAASFDQLVALKPHEIQVGILKRLKGSPIIRHTKDYELIFNPNPPFNILSSSTVTFSQVQALSRFARYWDLLANSGRFQQTLPLILAEQPFTNFSRFSSDLFNKSGQTHRISLLRLFDLVHDIVSENSAVDKTVLRESLAVDFARSGLKSIPRCLQDNIPLASQTKAKAKHRQRQARH